MLNEIISGCFAFFQGSYCVGYFSSSKKNNVFCAIMPYITYSIFGKWVGKCKQKAVLELWWKPLANANSCLADSVANESLFCDKL